MCACGKQKTTVTGSLVCKFWVRGGKPSPYIFLLLLLLLLLLPLLLFRDNAQSRGFQLGKMAETDPPPPPPHCPLSYVRTRPFLSSAASHRIASTRKRGRFLGAYEEAGLFGGERRKGEAVC